MPDLTADAPPTDDPATALDTVEEEVTAPPVAEAAAPDRATDPDAADAADPDDERFEDAGPTLDPERVPRLIESLLFVSDGPTDEGALARALRLSRRDVRSALDVLAESLRGRGIRLQRGPDGIQLVTAPDAASFIESFLGLESGRRLSAAALETLAIIAYRQPVTRGTLEAIRGVNCDGAIDTLRNRGLVDIAGRADAPGRPALFATTQKFLEYFGLERPEDLPPLPSDVAEAAARLPEHLAQQLPLTERPAGDAADGIDDEEALARSVPEPIETADGRVWPARGGLPYSSVALPPSGMTVPPGPSVDLPGPPPGFHL